MRGKDRRTQSGREQRYPSTAPVRTDGQVDTAPPGVPLFCWSARSEHLLVLASFLRTCTLLLTPSLFLCCCAEKESEKSYNSLTPQGHEKVRMGMGWRNRNPENRLRTSLGWSLPYLTCHDSLSITDILY
jgi:hypothetical protein